MARPTQEAIETFVSITGADEAAAVRVLEVTTPYPPFRTPPFPSHWSYGLVRLGIPCFGLGFGFGISVLTARGAVRWRFGGRGGWV